MSRSVFDKGQLNKAKIKRVAAFDLARGLAIILMIVIHVLSFYGSPEVKQSPFGIAVTFILSWPSAAIFVFLMGILVIYSKSQNLLKGLQRAAALFALGYLLNLLRETIPTWLSLNMGLVTYEQLGPYTPINGLLIIDILQYAGLAYAICILLKHFIPQPKIWLFIAVCIIFSSPFLWDIRSDIPALTYILKLLGGSKEQGVLFPIFPWLAYPIIGMVFGYWFKLRENQKMSFKYTLLGGIALVIIGAGITLSNRDFHIGYDLRPGPGLIVVITGIVFIWLWLCQQAINKIGTNPCLQLLYFWSANVTTLYFIHWLIIGWGLMLFGSEQLNLLSLLLWMTTVAVLSHFSLQAWLKVSKISFENKK